MAHRRMFAKIVTNSDDFLELPAMSQLLYFHLSMNADDDGFINNYRSIMRNIKATDEDLQVLFDNCYAYRFESKVIVMLDWLLNNLIRKNRYVATQFVKELAQLEIGEDKRYKIINGKPTAVQRTAKGQPKDVQCTAIGKPSTVQDSTGKDSKGKVSKGERPQADEGAHATNVPTIDEIRAFCNANNIVIDVDLFYNYYESRGWLVSGKPVKNWQALVKSWYVRDVKQRSQVSKPKDTDSSWLDDLGTII